MNLHHLQVLFSKVTKHQVKNTSTEPPVTLPSEKKKPTATEVECYYCHMKGHIVCESPALLRKREKSKLVSLLGCILVGNS